MSRLAAVYVRISHDPSGERLGVARQLKECRAKAEKQGWDVVEVYEDNDVSATGKRTRPAYERMLNALESGTVNAVVVWDLDRLTRRPVEIEHFIDLADRRGIALASVGGDVDLATDNGRLFARIKGAVARAEIERKSARQRAANSQRAEAGRPHPGRRAFGFTSDGMLTVAEEAVEIRNAAELLLAGASLRSIARGLNDRAVTTTAGNPWKPTELRRLLSSPRPAGLRVYRGEVVGRGTWPSILDEHTHHALKALLSDPSRRRAGRPRRYLLTGLARCGSCRGSIYGVTEPRGPIYYCETRRHVGRQAEPIDDLVKSVVVERLSRPDAASVFARDGSGPTHAELLEKERALRARLDGLAEAFAAGDIDREQLRQGSSRLRTALRPLTDELTSQAVTPAVTTLLTDDVTSTWDALDVDTQRAVVESLLQITVFPAGRGARTFDPSTVDIEWTNPREDSR